MLSLSTAFSNYQKKRSKLKAVAVSVRDSYNGNIVASIGLRAQSHQQ